MPIGINDNHENSSLRENDIKVVDVVNKIIRISKFLGAKKNAPSPNHVNAANKPVFF